jgi:hypothetical protein
MVICYPTGVREKMHRARKISQVLSRIATFPESRGKYLVGSQEPGDGKPVSVIVCNDLAYAKRAMERIPIEHRPTNLNPFYVPTDEEVKRRYKSFTQLQDV